MKHDAGTRESIAHRRDVSFADGRPYPRSGSFQVDVVICTAAPPSFFFFFLDLICNLQLSSACTAVYSNSNTGFSDDLREHISSLLRHCRSYRSEIMTHVSDYGVAAPPSNLESCGDLGRI